MQWSFYSVKLTEMEKQEVMATVVMIAVKFMFQSHIYTFVGKLYRQKSGGPIGLRGTCAVARLVMQMCDTKWLDRMARLCITLELAMRYMDDGRAFLFAIKAGWRWTKGELVFCKRWQEEDKDLTPTEVTKRVLHGTMQDLEDFLNFTVKTSDDFPTGWLPTLDTELRVTTNNIVDYNFYEKPMSSNVTVQRMSAMEENSKMKTLSNDLIRRLLNTSEGLGLEERIKVVDNYSLKLLNSGFKLEQVRTIIVNGVKGYERKVKESKRPGGRKFRRTSAESRGARIRKKLLDKTEWFKKRSKSSKEDAEKRPTNTGQQPRKLMLQSELGAAWKQLKTDLVFLWSKQKMED